MCLLHILWLIFPFALGLPIEVFSDEFLQNQWIVVLEPKTAPQTFLENLVPNLLPQIQQTQTYEWEGFSGFAATMQQAITDQLLLNGQVQYIEQDRTYQVMAHLSTRSANDEDNCPWGLARISHRSPGNTDYLYDSSSGTGTCVYVLDTGVYTEHEDFGGRATNLGSYVSDSDGDTDDNGHGTHVAGTIGGSTYGVAKNAKIYAIKVLDSTGSGAMSGILAGINAAVNDAANRDNCPNGKIVNMSFGGSKTNSLNQAVTAAINTGLFFAVAAGNEGINTNEDSPSSAAGAFPVGATDSGDNLAGFSNYGESLGVFAPGVGITSDWIGSPTATATIDGTSMSCAHVAGLAAYLMGLDGLVSPSAMSSMIKSLASSGYVQGIDGSSAGTPNIIAYNGIS